MCDYVIPVGTISKRVLIPAQRGAIPVWIEYAIYYSDQLHTYHVFDPQPLSDLYSSEEPASQRFRRCIRVDQPLRLDLNTMSLCLDTRFLVE